MFFRAYLGWSLKHVVQSDLFIALLCAKISRVNKALICFTHIRTSSHPTNNGDSRLPKSEKFLARNCCS